MIAIIDYGAGNIRSVQKAFEFVGFEAVVTSQKEAIDNASHLVLPGVGAFGDCLKGIVNLGLVEVIHENIRKGKPFLGICVGMQLLFEKSFEFGIHDGFGYFKGSIKRFPEEIVSKGMKIPHMGWNNVNFCSDHPVIKGIENESFFYFVHSYFAPVVEGETIGVCEYGVEFSAIVGRDNVIATQFHPEKSHMNGLKIIKNFGEWKC
ncbi:imidazole glycerol phosphate synthase subunit HisH [Deferribacter autotrophicus]|uniref:Imidazole glycerol phosphate synthase subunit HisH n=1 Tax=Deferribacter autotrophicus TaxID=500465 RepID=A0A5A8F659_9BACT|nr:imidazole glycerol phosphate synthase subunit HisH [Deferribacter autotrophicus]KAA0258893.1 imidazole glycerol phosphate synthase subunit HisH [Deferribacter autotrophicus]